MEAVALIQQRDEEAQANATQDVLTAQRFLIERAPNAPVLGNPDGDVTVVEFFDYNALIASGPCPRCCNCAATRGMWTRARGIRAPRR